MEHSNSINKVLLVLSFIGLVAAIFILRHHYRVNSPSFSENTFCSINETINCDVVAKSKYSEIFGIPIALFCILYYGFLTIVSFWNEVFRTKLSPQIKDRYSEAVFLLSSLGAIFTVIMIYISAVILKMLCLQCAFLYLINFIILYFSYRLLPKGRFFKSVAAGSLSLIELSLGFYFQISGRDKSTVPTGFSILLLVSYFALVSSLFVLHINSQIFL